MTENKLDRILELYNDYHDSPHEPIRKDIKKKFDKTYSEIQQAIEKAEKLDRFEIEEGYIPYMIIDALNIKLGDQARRIKKLQAEKSELKEDLDNEIFRLGQEIKQLQEKSEENQRIVERLKQDEEDMGRSLVDVQNWLSKDGKKNTEIIHGYIQSILKGDKE